MKQTYTILFFLLLLPNCLLAQENYKPATVVTITGDTLKGYINYQEWLKNPETVSFKASPQANARLLTPANSRYVEITGLEAYRSYAGPITMNYVELSRLSKSPEFITATDTVFLKVLEDGEYLSLLVYTDAVKTRYFVADKENSAVQELLYLRYRDGSNNLKQISQYRGQLWAIAGRQEQHNTSLRNRIEQLDYTEHELLKVVRAINGSSSAAKAQGQKGPSKTNFIFGSGLMLSAMKFENSIYLSEKQETSVTYIPLLNVGVVSFFNRHTKRLFIRADATVNQEDHRINSTRTWPGTQAYEENSYQLKVTNVSLAPKLMYSLFNRSNLRVYAGTGLRVTYSRYAGNTLDYRMHHNSDTAEPSYTGQRDNYLDLSDFWYAIPIQVGFVTSDRFDIYASFHKILKPGINQVLQYKSIQVGLNYVLN